MNPLRVAVASHAYPISEGAYSGQFVHELASAMVRLGHDVHAIVPSARGRGRSSMDGVRLEFYKARDRVSHGRADNQYIRSPRIAVAGSLVRAVHRLHQVVRANNVDIIHAHWAIPMGFVGAVVKMFTGLPLVITTHGRDVYADRQAGDIVPTLWYTRPFLRFSLALADQVISVSQDCARHAVRAGASPDRTVVIHNGIDLSRFYPSAAAPAEVRERYGISQHAKLALFVGSLNEHKGTDILLQAMPHVLREVPDASLLVVGEGPAIEGLLALRESLGLQDKVLFAGYIPNTEVPLYENACDVFVLPSLREPFGIAAVEAMGCAKPVIASRTGGLAEIIDHGETGLLTDPGNSEQLAAAIIRVLTDRELSVQLGRNAREKVETGFGWGSVARRTLDLYRGLL